ncbi:MAG: DUF3575 domain-containing protein [Saprospiraceae bacterium]|nr:DUF3575 domain-containing protein [Saprospiraceae bacterium]
MKKLVPVLFLFVPFFLFGQSQHELKLNILSSLDEQPMLQYEFASEKNIGVEFLAGYLKRGLVVGKASTAPLLDFQSFPRHFAVAGLALKYYVEPNSAAKGAHIGLYARTELQVAEKEGYEQAFRQAFGEEPVLESDNRLNLGAGMGYKWVISDHWIIEPQVRYGWNAVKPSTIQEWQGELFLSLGYRF